MLDCRTTKHFNLGSKRAEKINLRRRCMLRRALRGVQGLIHGERGPAPTKPTGDSGVCPIVI